MFYNLKEINTVDMLLCLDQCIIVHLNMINYMYNVPSIVNFVCFNSL